MKVYLYTTESAYNPWTTSGVHKRNQRKVLDLSGSLTSLVK